MTIYLGQILGQGWDRWKIVPLSRNVGHFPPIAVPGGGVARVLGNAHARDPLPQGSRVFSGARLRVRGV